MYFANLLNRLFAESDVWQMGATVREGSLRTSKRIINDSVASD